MKIDKLEVPDKKWIRNYDILTELFSKMNELISWQHEVEERLGEGKEKRCIYCKGFPSSTDHDCECECHTKPKPDKECDCGFSKSNGLTINCSVHGIHTYKPKSDKLQELLEWVEKNKKADPELEFEWVVSESLISKIKELMK